MWYTQICHNIRLGNRIIVTGLRSRMTCWERQRFLQGKDAEKRGMFSVKPRIREGYEIVSIIVFFRVLDNEINDWDVNDIAGMAQGVEKSEMSQLLFAIRLEMRAELRKN